MLLRQRGQRVLRLLADRQQLALECVLVDGALTPADEALADDRHLRDHGLAQAVQRGRHIAPAQQDLTFLGDEFLEMRDGEVAAGFILREEAHRHGIIAFGRQVHAGFGGPAPEQRIGHLDKDAGAIAEQRISAHRAPMIEVFENFQRLGDYRMAFSALDMGHEAHTACVVLVT